MHIVKFASGKKPQKVKNYKSLNYENNFIFTFVCNTCVNTL